LPKDHPDSTSFLPVALPVRCGVAARLRPRPSRRRPAAALMLAAALTGLVGCSAAPSQADGTRPASSVAAAPAAAGEDPVEAVERSHIIGPRLAAGLDYRVDWQVQPLPEPGLLRHVSVQGDSVFLLDERNFLMRVRRDDGAMLWRIPVGEPLLEVLGITLLPRGQQVVLTTGGSLKVFDAATGHQTGEQPISKIANTWPAQLGEFLIYGARNGQVVWHAWSVGYEWRGYQVSSSIQIRPVVEKGVVLAVGSAGRVMALTADSASGLWEKKLLGEVVATPVAGQGHAFVSCMDQFIYAFDLRNGRNAWRYLTESPLRDSPVLIGDRLFQPVPGLGLMCLNAVPTDAPGGEVLWTASGIDGHVLTRRRENLLVWDAAARRVTMLAASRGGVVRTADLPQVRSLIASDLNDGELLGVGNDGRLIRLLPR
jgi:outer membrane protein assembly factor BamB